VTAALVAGVALLMLAGAAGAGNNPAEVGDEAPFGVLSTPLGLQKGPVTVIVEVAGDPVTVVEANAGKKLSKGERDQIKANLKGKQTPIADKVKELGGTVQSSYQAAYNGIRVRVERSKLADIAALPNVVGVHAVQQAYPDNTNGVPLVGAPAVWDGLNGLHGEGIKIGIIDTGIDYTHADFNGPGTVAAWNTARASSTGAANPLWFGPAAPRVKGGIDLVGDDYNAASSDPAKHVPHPDPNPLDCFGHGSHVAGTAAGSGVKADGTTYTGPYNANTISSNSWNVGPGVAPKADLYAIRVFGCAGSTDVTVDGIEWAVNNDMDVINMSLGSPYGTADDPSAVASSNAAKDGIIVVASAGNSGASQYITGSPASATGAISVAANDPQPSFAGIHLALSTGQGIDVLNANGATVTNGTVLPIKVLRTGTAVSLGCKHPSGSPDTGADGTNEWVDVAGKLVVTLRGTCARVARAVFGQKEGAAAVAMVNTSTAFPPFEGKITGNPDTGEIYPVTIPFLGVKGLLSSSTSDGSKLVAADGGTATLTNVTLSNPNYKGFADFSSGGPRNGDSELKPDITAPGVSISSVGMGTGNGPAIMSGTSMAAPHTSGVAALVRQAHASWNKGEYLKAAVVNTADPAGVAGYRTSRGGTGFANALGGTRTQVVALGTHKTGSLSFGFEELKGNFSKSQSIQLKNLGSSTATFNVSQANVSGSPHSVAFGSGQVTVPAGGDASLAVTLNVPVSSAGNTDAFREVAGIVTLTPVSGGNNGVTLRVPYYLVPRALSSVDGSLAAKTVSTASPNTTATLKNGGPIAGTADFYAWGIGDKKDKGKTPNDVGAVGVQVFPNPSTADPNRRLLVFAVNTLNRWSNASTIEFDIYVDVDRDGRDDYIVVGADQGAVTAGTDNGVLATFVFSTRSAGASLVFLASAPTDGSTALFPVRTSQLCRASEPCLSKTGNPRLTYHIVTFDRLSPAFDAVPEVAAFNVWSPAISNGDFQVVPAGGSASSPVSIDPVEWAQTPAKGVMVVSQDNKAGKDEAVLLPLGLK